MEIQYGKQIKIDDLKNEIIDLFICTENHERRSYTLYDEIRKNNKISRSISLCYKEPATSKSINNIDKILIRNHDEIYKLLDKLLIDIKKDSITILIDYSCMTKSWYYSIILYFRNKKNSFKSILTYFSYTPATYEEPKSPKTNKDIGPLPGKYVVPTDKPKALIVCLGYEQNKAEGIIEHLDPKKFYLFYTNPASDKKFVSTLKKNNENLITNHKSNTIEYPFNDLLSLERKLTHLYYQLKDNYSVIIAPLGPKPFSLISMIMSIKYSEIDIWRVGSGYDINEYYNYPINVNSFIICELLFEDNED